MSSIDSLIEAFARLNDEIENEKTNLTNLIANEYEQSKRERHVDYDKCKGQDNIDAQKERIWRLCCDLVNFMDVSGKEFQ